MRRAVRAWWRGLGRHDAQGLLVVLGAAAFLTGLGTAALVAGTGPVPVPVGAERTGLGPLEVVLPESAGPWEVVPGQELDVLVGGPAVTGLWAARSDQGMLVAVMTLAADDLAAITVPEGAGPGARCDDLDDYVGWHSAGGGVDELIVVLPVPDGLAVLSVSEATAAPDRAGDPVDVSMAEDVVRTVRLAP